MTILLQREIGNVNCLIWLHAWLKLDNRLIMVIHAMCRHNVFKVENVIKMLPKWIESDVESFLQAFERLAVANDWPEDKYLVIIQTQFSPKALKYS